MTYPAWSYFPRNVRPPAWARSFVEVVQLAEAKIYRTTSSGREQAIHAYERTRSQLDAIYASQRLKLPFEGVLLVGY
jgi:hypothetical protein